MASVTVTGTADQLLHLSKKIREVALSSSNPRAVALTIDNAPAGSFVSLVVPNDPKGRRDL